MSTKWDSLTPEQQRAIGEAAIEVGEYSSRDNSAVRHMYGEALADLCDAVRAAECPTWKVCTDDDEDVLCSDGRSLLCYTRGMAQSGCRDNDHEYRSVLAAALNAHEREKRGLK